MRRRRRKKINKNYTHHHDLWLTNLPKLPQKPELFPLHYNDKNDNMDRCKFNWIDTKWKGNVDFLG